MRLSYVGYEKITSLSSSVGLSLPIKGNYILVDIEGENVRYKGDGTDPTSTDGGLLLKNAQYEYGSNLNNLKFIEVTAGASINVSFFNMIGD